MKPWQAQGALIMINGVSDLYPQNMLCVKYQQIIKCTVIT